MTLTATQRDHLLALEDKALIQRCELDTRRGSGPGGQKRNKTESAVRLTLPGTGISATSDATRSQHQNRRIALHELRIAIALAVRAQKASRPSAPRPSASSPNYPAWIARLLDCLHAHQWAVGEAATDMGWSTGKLAKIITGDPILMAHVNRERQRRGMRLLR